MVFEMSFPRICMRTKPNELFSTSKLYYYIEISSTFLTTYFYFNLNKEYEVKFEVENIFFRQIGYNT